MSEAAPRILLLIATLLGVLILSACSGTTTHSPDGDEPDGDVPDGDEVDGDNPDGDEPDGGFPDGDENPWEILEDSACRPDGCREGFTGAPGCVLLDEERFALGLRDDRCTDDSECAEGEVCTYATPNWLCVDTKLPHWLGIYSFDADTCAFAPVAATQTGCSLVGAWETDSQPVWLEQCPEARDGRLCTAAGCEPITGMGALTLISATPCPPMGGTALTFYDDRSWPPELVSYRYDGATLAEVGRAEMNWHDMNDHRPGLGVVCTEEDAILVSPSSLMRYRDGGFERLIPVNALGPVFGRGEHFYATFDAVVADRQDPKLLHIALKSSYEAYLLTWRLDKGARWTQTISVEEGLVYSVLPQGNGEWLIATEAGCFLSQGGDELDLWFTLGDNETLVGLNAEGWVLTRTLTRVFRRPPAQAPLPVALDTGLPFPGEYMYYLPTIRHLFFQPGDNEHLTLVLQYRPTGR